MITEIIQSLIIIIFETICCVLFLNIFLQKKNYFNEWFVKSKVFFISVGFFLVSMFLTHFLVKSILIILVVILAVKIYYSATLLKTLVFSSIYYGILIGIDYVLLRFLNLLLPDGFLNFLSNKVFGTIIALLCKTLLLLVVVAIKRIWKTEDNLDKISNKEWICLLFFPLFTIISMAGMLYAFPYSNQKTSNVFLMIAFGLVTIDFLVFYLIYNIVNREEAIQTARLMTERTKNQMNVYRNMHEAYEKQRKKTHDYKNQLICIQGMLSNGKSKKANEYIINLTGNIIKDMDIFHTNHAVVDSIINQKYKYAQDKGITVIMKVNDLSHVTIKEEDLVVILSNAIDNGIEACEKLIEDKIIKFKVVAEKNQLIISVQNPVKDSVSIVNNKIVSTKEDKKEHGIGLLNIAEVVEKYGGSYAVQCTNGWFYLTVLIPF